MIKKITDSRVDDINHAADNAVKTLAIAADSATKILAEAAKSASQLIASNAADALKVSNVKSSDDHDILVVLKSKMEDLKNDIKDLKDSTTKRVDNLEQNKLNISDSYAVLYKSGVEIKSLDHENRIRDNEKNITKIMTYGSIILVIIGIIEFFVLHFDK